MNLDSRVQHIYSIKLSIKNHQEIPRWNQILEKWELCHVFSKYLQCKMCHVTIEWKSKRWMEHQRQMNSKEKACFLSGKKRFKSKRKSLKGSRGKGNLLLSYLIMIFVHKKLWWFDSLKRWPNGIFIWSILWEEIKEFWT